MKLFRIDVPIFNFSVVCCLDCDVETAVSAIYDYKKKRSVVQPTQSCGWVQSYAGDVFMWVGDSKRIDVIVHEVVHAAYTGCEVKGMEPQEELIAYLVGYLHPKIISQIG